MAAQVNHNAEVKTQFEFTGGQKKFFIGLIAVGLVSMLITWFIEPGMYPSEVPGKYVHSIFWTNFFHGAYMFTGVAFAALLFIATHALAYGGWHTAFKRIPEAMMMFLPIGAACMAFVWVGAMFNWHGLYMWSDPETIATDKLVNHKSLFLNNFTYGIAIAIVLVWFFFAFNMRKLSVQEDSKGFASNMAKTKVWGAVFLPIAGFSSAFAIWLFMMSVDTHWYSTMFAWYNTAGFFVTSVCFIILILQYLQGKGYFPQVSKEHFHDLGKFAFGISVFWTYLWFSQYMLIWYSNNGEETQYFYLRHTQFEPLFIANLVLNFGLPFLILIRNTSKRRRGILGFAAGLIIFGHWIDMYQMVKPGVWHNIEHAYHHEMEHKEGTHGEHTLNISTESTSTNSNEGHAVLTSNEGEHPTDAKTEHPTQEAHPEAEAHPEHGHGLKSFMLGIHMPGPLELGTFCFFLGLFLFTTFTYLAKDSLYAKNDAYMAESEHHHSTAYEITE